MDPLSIAASAAGLAASAASLSVWLYELVNNIKSIDSKIADLCKEVTQLSGLLVSVEKTVKQCQAQALTLAHLDQHMWEQIENTLADCQSNVDGLDRLIIKLSSEYDTDGKTLSRLLKKPSLHFHFTIHKDEVQDYTNKIFKSNCAMQTTLAVVSVSLNFRANVSQESLFQELHKLKGLVQESLRAAGRQETALDPVSARQSRNLERLAKAAKQFHTTASSTASTCYAPERRPSTSNWGGSEIGGLTDLQRERIERWNDSNELTTVDESTEDSVTESSQVSGHGDSSTTFTTPDDEERPQGNAKQPDHPIIEEEDSDDESDIDLDFLRNFEELAYASFLAKDYNKAEKCLRMAVERSTGDATGDSNFKQLKMQLALCCCLQEKWDHATVIITSLPKAKSADNLPVFDLLQAIVIANMIGNRLEDAFNTCKTVLQGKKKVFGRKSKEYHECLWLFATIYDKRGHPLEAEAVRHSLPRNWKPSNAELLDSPKEYIIRHDTLVQSIFSSHAGKDAEESQPKDRAQEASMSQSGDPHSSSEDVYSGHWKTLIPKEVPDGYRRAEHEDKRGVQIAETDTGKEFVVQSVPGITFDLLSESRQSYSQEGSHLRQFNALQQTTELRHHDVAHQEDRTPADGPGVAGQCSRQNAQMSLKPTLFPQRPTSLSKHGITRSVDFSLPGGVTNGSISETSPGSSMPMRSISQRLPSIKTSFSDHLNELSRSHTQRYKPFRRDEVTYESPDHIQQLVNQGNNFGARERAIEGGSSSSVLKPTKSINRPLSHSRLIERVEQAQNRSKSTRGRPETSRRPNEQVSGHQSFIEDASGSNGEELYSTLEVLTVSGNASSAPDRSTTPSSSSWNHSQQIHRQRSPSDFREMDAPRIRWTVHKDICNIGETRPTSQLLCLSRYAAPNGPSYVGISFGAKSTSSLAINMGTGTYETTLCQISPQNKPDAVPQTPTLAMKDFFRKANFYSRKESSLTDDSRYTVGISSPRDWLVEDCLPNKGVPKSRLMGDERELFAEHISAIRRFESEIARTLCRGQMESYFGVSASLRADLEGLVYALPDYFVRYSWETSKDILEKSTLLQHAKVIPQSHAIVQYYLDTGAFALDKYETGCVVVVLNCDEKLVDCTPYFFEIVSPEYAEITESESSYMAEMAGPKHAEAQFAKLVSEQLKLTVREMRHKFDESSVEEIMQSCCDQFQQKILPDFTNDGREWTVDFEMPSGVPGFRNGSLTFTNAEMWRCFMPSVSMIEEMLETTVEKLSESNLDVSHILLAGSYSRSKYLRRQLDQKLASLRRRNRGMLNMCYSPGGEDLCVLGALSHAIGTCA